PAPHHNSPASTMPAKNIGSAGAGDTRFSRLSSDPRYRLQGKKNAKVGVDKRFSRMFKEDDQDFNRKAKVDKYGRKVKAGLNKEQKSLQNLYKEDDEDEESEPEPAEPRKDEQDEVDDDAQVAAELARVNAKYDPARDGGFSSSSDSDSSDEESEVEDAELPEEDEASRVPMGDASSRLAIVNLDWDNIRAADIYAVAASFVPENGHIKSCAIYPSEFGKERLEREELEGPPKELFASSKSKVSAAQNGLASDDEDEDDEEDDAEEDERIRKKLQQGDEGGDFDMAALRRYQLDRLRYFYAVLTCSSATVAQAIYTELDGKEYMTTANFFDMRFIPDEVDFDEDKPRESITKLPPNYKPNEFVTEALTHSKVKLTWDADDASRKEVQKRAFSRKEIDDNDLKAYIGGSSDSESDNDAVEPATEDAPKLSKKDAERQRMRAALGLSTEDKPSKRASDRPVGDMQVTFTSGLSSAREGGVFENSPPRDETTRERYVRKEKERKARRREKAKSKRDGTEEKEGEESGSDVGAASSAEDKGFDDPFFNEDAEAPSKSKKEKLRKADRLAKRDAKRAEAERKAGEKAELQALMDEEGGEGMAHFDMKAEAKAAKLARKGKKKKKGKVEEESVAPEPIETADPRFARLYESHEFAIDPTNPRFSKTPGMQSLMEEGRKRRRNAVEDGEEEEGRKKGRTEREDGGDDTQKLLARVKARGKMGRN
ncbi:hypothetical protein K461DRAFT_231927, partial [Myriangium duriaei CBS 260.36]